MNGIMTSRYADREHILQEFGGLIIAYNHYSNDPPAFLASAQYQSHLSSLPPIPPLLFRSHYSTSSTPSPASRDPNSPLNQTTFPAALDPFLDFPPPEHDTDCRLLLPPSCSPNACSGRPPIEKNRLLAEKLVVGLLCFEYYFKLLDDDSNLRVASAMAVAITLGSMEVSTEEDQRRASAALPKVLVAIAYRRHDGGTDEKWMEEDTVLAMAVFRHQAQLRTVNNGVFPCACDLTYLCEKLYDLVKISKAKFDSAASLRPAQLTQDTVSSSQQAVAFKQRALELPGWPFEAGQWESKVDDFVLFLDSPTNDLLFRSPLSRVHGFIQSRKLLHRLGAAGILELSFSTGAFDSTRVYEASLLHLFIRALRDVINKKFGGAPVEDVLVMLRSETSKSYQAQDVGKCLVFSVVHQLLDPLDSIPRLNSAAMRLRLSPPNDEDQRYQWTRVIYDTTMALDLAPPNFKAYYRRGVALARLKLWTKAIADFKRALDVEPGNVVVIEQIKLARMRRA